MLGYGHRFTDVDYHNIALILYITIWKCSQYRTSTKVKKKGLALNRGIGLFVTIWKLTVSR